MIPDCETMFEAGVHIGHQLKRWNPKFSPYLYKHIQGISIIDLELTRTCLERAVNFLAERLKQGAKVLLVGTKPAAQEFIRNLGQATGMPFCANRWLGGCLTNFRTIQASLAKYRRFLELESSGELDKMLKKESSVIRRTMAHMHRGFEGILSLDQLPDIVFVVDVLKEAIAIREARRLGIPIIGIVDTNGDPSLLDYPIPANDDSSKSLSLIFEAIQTGMLGGTSLSQVAQSKLEGKAPSKEAMSPQAKSWIRKRPTFGNNPPVVAPIAPVEPPANEAIKAPDDEVDEEEVKPKAKRTKRKEASSKVKAKSGKSPSAVKLVKKVKSGKVSEQQMVRKPKAIKKATRVVKALDKAQKALDKKSKEEDKKIKKATKQIKEARKGAA